MALKTVIDHLARRLPCASELFSMLEKKVYEAEKPLRMAPASFKRLSLRDIIPDRNEKLRQKPETVIDVPPEAQSATNQKLDAVLIALHDA